MMVKALIVYGSTTGNTEAVAEQIGKFFQGSGIDVTVKNVTATKVEELGAGFDLTMLGSSTWGADDIEFQEDFAPFFDELDSAALKGKKVAIFGCGDSSYEHFCGAVDLLEEKMLNLGANLLNEPLRIDGDPEDAAPEILSWITEITEKILQGS
jgi:flavodoxin I